MTHTEQDKELQEQIYALDRLRVKTDPNLPRIGSVMARVDDIVALIIADRKRVALEARIDPFDFVESCEPDCDEVRHAYHQGQWDMATRIEAQQEEV